MQGGMMVDNWRRAVWITCAALVLLCATTAPAEAQRSGQTLEVFENVGIDDRLGEDLPLELTFMDEEGRSVQLGDYFDGERPVLLNLVYHECPMLCSLMLDGFTETLKDLTWTPGDQFEVLTVSFNARETPEMARRQKVRYLNEYGRDGAADGWHFLTGDEDAIDALTEAVGFKFEWIEEKQEFAHPSAVMFFSGEGTLSRYLFGLSPSARDTRAALVEASGGQVGNILDQAILYCFQFDPNENSYVANAFNIMRLGGLLTVILLGAMLFVFWRRENRRLETPLEAQWADDPEPGDEAAIAT